MRLQTEFRLAIPQCFGGAEKNFQKEVSAAALVLLLKALVAKGKLKADECQGCAELTLFTVVYATKNLRLFGKLLARV